MISPLAFGIVVGVRCHYCSRFCNPHEVVNFGESMVRCWRCQEKHQAALEFMAGHRPTVCCECGVTFAELAAATAEPHVCMFVHWKDGLYQLLCSRCDARYVEQRKDLYGPTRFGLERKLR